MRTELIKILSSMAIKEKKLKEYKRRLRIRGTIIKKGVTKNKNIRLIIRKGDSKYNFIVMRTHRDRFALAERLKKGNSVSAEGISRFRALICTRLRQIERIDESRQTKLDRF